MSKLAVFAGIVKPVLCTACGGTGKDLETMQADDVAKALNEDPLCPECHDRGWKHVQEKRLLGAYMTPVMYFEGCACRAIATSIEIQAMHRALCGCSAEFLMTTEGG